MEVIDSAFRVFLRIGCTLSEDDLRYIENALESFGPEGHLKVRKGPRGGFVKIDIGSNPRPEPLLEMVVRLGDGFARRLARSSRESAGRTVISIVQVIDEPDDPIQKGIAISPELVNWAAAAEASFDIDQSMYTDDDDE
ncbi:hypothetical protein [Nocardiopsis trehalosi]|uniref:hypothetical protein n=1 Tax=Nocardiopsis trehalosi TaxID=109329 RepID=UPI00082F90DD|nr:hypothetical protein [Nocardiopsis trehalosi]